MMCEHAYGFGMPLSPEQSRAARGWLDWSQQDLADKANVSLSTVRDFEKARRLPISNNLDAMGRAFTDAGCAFETDGAGKAVGIKFSPRP